MSSENNNGSLVSVRIPSFDGKRDDYIIWECKFRARARFYGYARILSGNNKVIKKTDYEAILAKAETTRTDEEKSNKEIYENNTLGYDHLILAIDGTTRAGKNAFYLVVQAKTTDLPDGDLKLAYDHLKSKYSPTTTTGYIKLYRCITQSELGYGVDPDTWITEMETMVNDANDIKIGGKSKISQVDLC